MFYNYAWLILSLSGTLFGITGYYLDITLPGNYGGLLWTGVTGVIAASGLIAGSVIRKLSLLSHTDFLTGLWNRRYFYQVLQKHFCQAAAQKLHLCVAMIDVDGFKTINDTYGHTTGDQLLSFKKKCRQYCRYPLGRRRVCHHFYRNYAGNLPGGYGENTPPHGNHFFTLSTDNKCRSCAIKNRPDIKRVPVAGRSCFIQS